MAIENLITDHLDLWTSAVRPKSISGRGNNSKLELTGIKKLRELILELAVRGKLVAQDPHDEPVSALLNNIAAEKARLIAKGEMKKTKSLLDISEDDTPFKLPEGWVWQWITDVFYPISVSGNKIKTAEILDIGAVPVVDQGKKFVAGYTDRVELEITLPGPVIVFGDHTSALKYIDFNFVAGADGVKILRPICICERYFYLVCNTLPIENRGYGRHYSRLLDNKFPLPPMGEQRRIVAKVDDLMALCDQLEQCSESQLAAHQALVETLLATLTESDDAEELAQNWARLAQHFDTLFTTEASIDALKQTILQLAVMGKLVRQDPSDEPASVLLERISIEKAQLVKEGKIKKEKPLSAISEVEKPFELPAGWEWCRLNDLALSSEAGWSPQCESTPRENNKWGVLKVSAVTWGVFKPEENKELPESLEPRPEYEVKPGDFLISRANTAELVARAVIVSDDAPANLMMSDKIIRFKFSKLISSHFINMVNNSMFSRLYYAKVAGGTSSSMRNVSRGQIQNLVIALPPISEALQIIDRTNELMVICDLLKARLQTNQQTQLALAESLVEGALA